MAWNVTLLVVAVLILGLYASVEYTKPLNEASELPHTLAPQLGVPEDRLREVMLEEFFRRDDVEWRMMVRGAPMGFLTALLALRLILDWRSARRNPSKEGQSLLGARQ